MRKKTANRLRGYGCLIDPAYKDNFTVAEKCRTRLLTHLNNIPGVHINEEDITEINYKVCNTLCRKRIAKEERVAYNDEMGPLGIIVSGLFMPSFDEKHWNLPDSKKLKSEVFF